MRIKNNLYDKLSQSSLDDWDEYHQEAFKSMDLNRIRAFGSDTEELIGYMIAIFNEIIYDFVMPVKLHQVFVEDLEDWIERFDIVESLMENL
jgi:hypothetical protein